MDQQLAPMGSWVHLIPGSITVAPNGTHGSSGTTRKCMHCLRLVFISCELCVFFCGLLLVSNSYSRLADGFQHHYFWHFWNYVWIEKNEGIPKMDMRTPFCFFSIGSQNRLYGPAIGSHGILGPPDPEVHNGSPHLWKKIFWISIISRDAKAFIIHDIFSTD